VSQLGHRRFGYDAKVLQKGSHGILPRLTTKTDREEYHDQGKG
jgi:hypothetical protein